MNMPNHDRAHLLKAARGGDDDALGELIEKFRPMLRAEALRTLTEVQGRCDASDAIQMTWWSAFRAFPKFEGDVDAFIGWLRNIHERNLRDVVRDQRAAKRAVHVEVSTSAVLPEAPGKITSPSQKLVRIEEQQHMEECLSQLPPPQKEALRLRYYDELPIAEIVERMGRSETAIAGLLKRGLSALRELMGKEQR